MSKNGGISLVVYVHGWKHNAHAQDDNVKQFHSMLQSVSLVEKTFPLENRRRVVGIHVSWRGLSATLEPFKEASFWARKTAALHVAQGSARYFLARLRAFQRTENCKANSDLCAPAIRQTKVEVAKLKQDTLRAKVRMIVIGHSFGGLIVFNAISEYLIESLTEEGEGSTEASHSPVPVQRFADMVNLLNPAFEAIRYTPLQRVAARRAYDHYQAPILVSITSSADIATRVFFKAGRQLNTVLEHEASEEESLANVNTVGNVEQYITHDLTGVRPDGAPVVCPAWIEGPKTPQQMKANLRLEAKEAASFIAHWGQPTGDDQVSLRPFWTRSFRGGATLTHRTRGANPESPYLQNNPNSPIWNVRTDASLVPSHSDIDGPFFAAFIRQLYHDSAIFPAIE